MADDDKDPGLIGAIKDKLVASKEKWAREGRLLTGRPAGAGRLPPGQRLVREWPVLDLGIQPTVREQDWKLRVDGLIAEALTWDWNDFLEQPQSVVTCDMHCVTAWSRYDNEFAGVAMRHLLDQVKPRETARFAMLHSHDGYTTNVSLDMLSDPDVILAHSWDGAPLTREHGGPVRLIMPRYYLWKSAKWLKRIEFMADDKPGFWENRGYHMTGDPWREQRYG